jgi:hypothetical protein
MKALEINKIEDKGYKNAFVKPVSRNNAFVNKEQNQRSYDG